MTGVWKKVSGGANPFFGVVCVATIALVAGVVLAPNSAPGYALNAKGVYRLEIGLACFLVVYLVGLALQLAHQGRSLGKLQVGGVSAGPLPDPNLTAARDGFDEFERVVKERLDKHDDSLEDIDGRLNELLARVVTSTPGDPSASPPAKTPDETPDESPASAARSRGNL